MDWATMDADQRALEQRTRMRIGAALLVLALESVDADIVVTCRRGRKIAEVLVDANGAPRALVVAMP